MKRVIDTLTKADQDRVEAAFDCALPKVLPASWQKLDQYSNAGWFRQGNAGLAVCFEVEQVDGDLWIHISLSLRAQMPSYEDLATVKAVFLGPDRKAILVLPPKGEHYNLHPFCLHLYSPITRDPLPDFRAAEGQL